MRRAVPLLLAAVALIALTWLASRSSSRADAPSAGPLPDGTPSATTSPLTPSVTATALAIPLPVAASATPPAAAPPAAATEAPDERAFAEIRALVDQNDIRGARLAAERFYDEHPGSPVAVRVWRLTGVHPPPVLGPR